MRYTLVFILVLFAIVHVDAQTAEEKSPTAKKAAQVEASNLARVDQLVAELGAKDFKIREAADQALRKMGKRALPGLKRHVDHQDVETRTRVRTLIENATDTLEPIKPLVRSDSPQAEKRTGKRVPRRRLGERVDPFNDFRRRMDDILGGSRGGSNKQQMSFSSATSLGYQGNQLTLAQGSSGLKFSVRPRVSGGETKIYEAKDLTEFKTKHADVYQRFKGSGIFENAPLEFNIVVPGQKKAPFGQLDASRALEERLKKLLDSRLDSSFGNGGVRIESNDELMKELEERLSDLFKRTDRGNLFRDMDRTRRRQRMDLNNAPKKRMLGVEVSLPPAKVALEMARQDRSLSGLYVGAVATSSLADDLGLQTGDVILRLNGQDTLAIEDLRRAFKKTKPGDTLNLQIWRAGELKTLSETIPGEIEKPLPKIKKLKKI